MKHTILITAVSAFAAACNKAVAASDLALDIRDIALAPDGSIAAVLAPIASRHASASGSVHNVTVLQGAPAEVQKKLDSMVEQNPYTRPIKLLVPAAGASAADEDAPAKKKKTSIILVVGTYQP